MRWEGQRESENIEDRRQEGGYRQYSSPFGGGLGLSLLSFGRGKGILLIILLYLGLSFLGYNPARFLFGDGTLEKKYTQKESTLSSNTSHKTKRDHFIAAILAQTEDVWTNIFQKHNLTYQKPILVRFTGHTQSGCGFASSAMGPFYCPLDHKLYLDDHFFDQLAQKFGAPGEFAQAYVIAHEVGHHVQNLLKTLQKTDQEKAYLTKKEANALSVKIELQADCYAGIWAHFMKDKALLEAGDIESALNAAYQIGDDTLERKAQGYVVPDSFTHGTSQQRVEWFKRGYETGDLRACDSFSAL